MYKGVAKVMREMERAELKLRNNMPVGYWKPQARLKRALPVEMGRLNKVDESRIDRKGDK